MSYTARLGSAWPRKKVTVGSTLDDSMEKFPLKGPGETHLWSTSLEICHQICINDWQLERTIVFEFKFTYKYGMLLHFRAISS